MKSPFADEGKEHSPLIGWAFDGFAIYGPYEGNGVMAKDFEGEPAQCLQCPQDAEARLALPCHAGQVPLHHRRLLGQG